ncbi:cell division protein FtsX [Actinoplanes lutulentus]|uniref:FtsX extracellular domain-containing protein n=1 Tax=Actinoplanes lutulentus TaxID=1287878 RepID=A0A327ZKE5_9ACTN|nr:permease-like cell division protein FtsX [Actinoplanes lutulentus]MBB2941118.1 cell division protein FtsX [Actinoplanes lutulentus]RAK43427.1 hypothetical protein B0I29_101557 [Actinoplanes lutulentus]
MTEPDAPPAPKHQGRLLYFVVAAASALVGGAVALAVLFLAGYRPVPVHRYEIIVTLDRKATAEQDAGVRAFLEKLPSAGSVTVTDRDELFERVRQGMQAEGIDMPDGMTAADLAVTLKISTVDPDFDCSAVSALHDTAGVDEFGVTRTRGGSGQVATLLC